MDVGRISANGPENKKTNDHALHHRDDIDRLYVSRKEGGRELTNIDDSVDTSIKRFEDNMKNNKESLITESTQTTQISTEQR